MVSSRIVSSVHVFVGEGDKRREYVYEGKFLAAESEYFNSKCSSAAHQGSDVLIEDFPRMDIATWEYIVGLFKKNLTVVPRDVERLLPWICWFGIPDAMDECDKQLARHCDLYFTSKATGARVLEIFDKTSRYGLKKARRAALKRLLESIVGICHQPGGYNYFRPSDTNRIVRTLNYSEKRLSIHFILGHMHRRPGSIGTDGGQMAIEFILQTLLDKSEPLSEMCILRCIFCRRLLTGERISSKSPIKVLQKRILDSLSLSETHGYSRIEVEDLRDAVHTMLVQDK